MFIIQVFGIKWDEPDENNLGKNKTLYIQEWHFKDKNNPTEEELTEVISECLTDITDSFHYGWDSYECSKAILW